MPNSEAVKFQEMVYRLSLDILYIFVERFCCSTKRSTIVDRGAGELTQGFVDSHPSAIRLRKDGAPIMCWLVEGEE